MQEFKAFQVRIDNELYSNLKKLSFLSEKSMNKIISESLEKMITDYKKVLTNSGIMVS